MADYYQILGISKDASPEDIKRAYRKLAHKYHPDKGGDEGKFKEASEAYQVLSNKEKRAQYDRFGQTFDGAEGFEGFEGFGAQPGGGFDFGSGAAGLEDLFEDFLGFGRKARRRNVNQGRNIEVEMRIDLEDTLKGFSKAIKLPMLTPCKRCQGLGAEPGFKLKECFSCRGSGEVQQMKRTILGTITHYVICPECGGEGKIPEKPCNVCKGEGRVKEMEKIDVFVPSGVDSGQTIKIDGKGEAGRRGAESGDLYVRISVKPHSLLERRGDDLFVSMPISFSQASLGDEIEVPTLDGKKILLKVPQASQSGKILRISNKGIPHFSSFGKGNLYVELVIETPKKLTKKQKELLEKLKEEGL